MSRHVRKLRDKNLLESVARLSSGWRYSQAEVWKGIKGKLPRPHTQNPRGYVAFQMNTSNSVKDWNKLYYYPHVYYMYFVWSAQFHFKVHIHASQNGLIVRMILNGMQDIFSLVPFLCQILIWFFNQQNSLLIL